MTEHAPLSDGLLNQAPCGIAVIGSNGRINWVNQALQEMLGQDSLSGHAIDELPQPISTLLGNTAQPVQLASRWLSSDRRQGDGESVCIVHDVTAQQQLADENARLRRQVEELKLTDDLTGLPNKRAIKQALELQISRSRRYQNPLSVVMVHVALADDQIELLSNGADPLVLGVSRFLRDRLRWVDQIGRWEENIFILVLPETERPHAEGLVEKIRAEQPGMLLPEPFSGIQPVLSFGIGDWHKGDDLRTLLRQVTENLQQD